MLQQFPTGKTNAEDTCQKVTYTYGTVLDASSTMGRLASVQYSVCVPGHTKTVTESYNYHPAGALMGKSLATSICGTDEGVSGCPGVGLFVGYSRDTKGAVTSWNYSGQTAPFVYGSDWAGRHVSMSQLTGVSWRSDPVLTMLVKDGAYDLAGRLSQLTTRSGGIRHQRYIWMEDPGWFWEDVFADAYVAETRSYNVMGQLTSQRWASLPAPPVGLAVTVALLGGGLMRRKSCLIPMVDDLKAEFSGDAAKLKWPVSIDGKKIESETYKIMGILDNK